LLAAFWHIPANFDAAVIDGNIHIVMHVTFTSVGILLFVGAGMLTGRMRHVLVLVPGKAMGILEHSSCSLPRTSISLPTDQVGFGYGGYDAGDGFDDRSIFVVQLFRKNTYVRIPKDLRC
jgi:hypothetical protein